MYVSVYIYIYIYIYIYNTYRQVWRDILQLVSAWWHALWPTCLGHLAQIDLCMGQRQLRQVIQGSSQVSERCLVAGMVYVSMYVCDAVCMCRGTRGL